MCENADDAVDIPIAAVATQLRLGLNDFPGGSPSALISHLASCIAPKKVNRKELRNWAIKEMAAIARAQEDDLDEEVKAKDEEESSSDSGTVHGDGHSRDEEDAMMDSSDSEPETVYGDGPAENEVTMGDSDESDKDGGSSDEEVESREKNVKSLKMKPKKERKKKEKERKKKEMKKKQKNAEKKEKRIRKGKSLRKRRGESDPAEESNSNCSMDEEDHEDEEEMEEESNDGGHSWVESLQDKVRPCAERLARDIICGERNKIYLASMGIDVENIRLDEFTDESLDAALRILSRIMGKLVEDESKDSKPYLKVSTASFFDRIPFNAKNRKGDIDSMERIAKCAETILLIKALLESDCLVARFGRSLTLASSHLQSAHGLISLGVSIDGAPSPIESLLDLQNFPNQPTSGVFVDLRFKLGPKFEAAYRSRFLPWERLGRNIKTLFTVQPACKVASLLRYGFQPYSVEAPHLSIGRGLTFLGSPQDALEYYESRASVSAGPLYIFVVKVACGNILQCEENPEKWYSSAPRGYHSIHLQREASQEEQRDDSERESARGRYIVFDDSQVVPLSFGRVVEQK